MGPLGASDWTPLRLDANLWVPSASMGRRPAKVCAIWPHPVPDWTSEAKHPDEPRHACRLGSKLPLSREVGDGIT